VHTLFLALLGRPKLGGLYDRPDGAAESSARFCCPRALPLRPLRFFADHAIEFLPGRSVLGIDRVRRGVSLNSGDELEYSDLVLATGARNRLLDVPGAAAAGNHSLRTLDDAETPR
jgi:3-phenylpropionate/trans-cinnamate dioxygenase ferredoxin reductase subunit